MQFNAIVCAGVATIAVWFVASACSAARQAAGVAPPGQTIKFAEDIQEFEQADTTNPPKPGEILVVGSSIMRLWETLDRHMAPLPVTNRAFGGSRTWEQLAYLERIVLPRAPRIIVYYCGSNDINSGQSAEGIVSRFVEFSEKVRARLPKTRIYYLSILRAPQKRDRWSIADDTNRQVKAYCDRSSDRYFVDINPAVFTQNGEPRMELYLPDQLHYKPEAYDEFAKIVRPVLESAWRDIGQSR